MVEALLVRFRHSAMGGEGRPPALRNEALAVQVTGEQFAWNVHYPGPDGVFGRTAIELIDLQSNPLGLDRDDPRRRTTSPRSISSTCRSTSR